MAPKKQQKQKGSSATAKPTASVGHKLQLSSENENRLRRLLLSSGRSAGPSTTVRVESRSKAQTTKRLLSVYEKLSCDGFKDEQVERALSSLKENVTYEAALDWLCLNLTGDELPLKFSSGSFSHAGEGSVGIISTAREDWVPSSDFPSDVVENNNAGAVLRRKNQRDDERLDPVQRSQADWILQYMEHQDEDDFDSWETNSLYNISSDKPKRNYESILEDYCRARGKAAIAKERGDKKSQEEAGLVIRNTKEEILALGLSPEILETEFVNCSYRASEGPSSSINSCEYESSSVDSKSGVEANQKDFGSGPPIPLSACPQNGDELVKESGDVELGDFFLDDESCAEPLPSNVLGLKHRERIRELCGEKNLEKLEGIWKKGDAKKMPKAFLHQLCQRSGWEAPKYEKILSQGHASCYSVSILRKASGRGKSRKAGGLTTIQLPAQDAGSSTPEDAQNKVAAYALHSMFPDLPIQLVLSEPYSVHVMKWKEAELLSTVEDLHLSRRVGFVDTLLRVDNIVDDVRERAVVDKTQITLKRESTSSFRNPSVGRSHQNVIADGIRLQKEEERKRGMKKYKEMLHLRESLPIAAVKDNIISLLQDNDVIVISGETGCGKTTQVPQYILDSMIEAGNGGNCNIICTQPRRIAAVSVAERVANERCDSYPGSYDSLVGYHVRLDNSSNERTKLLFCTTGILLRMMLGNKDLADVSHVIVDEVHERSLLGDFLLIVLKNLIEKQHASGQSTLKVILMSATVNSRLFSTYFSNCPVVTAQGRTYPVSVHFLEDIYQDMKYHLAPDSPAAIKYGKSWINEGAPIDNKRGKKNLVLSGWGDDSLLLEEIVNPNFVSSDYLNYSHQTRQNLKRLNEDVIDYDLLQDLVCHIDETYPEGAILVFLPGIQEINMLLEGLTTSRRFGGDSSNWILPLHSSLTPEDQKKVFLKPPEHVRKVIVATNIAETSITIDDVVYVVDCGKHKESRYNPQKKLSSMVEDWISKANARQRRGRAGRVKPGMCFCLYTRCRYENLLRDYQLPEMMRVPLNELCLQVKLLSLGGIKQFLSKALEPPREEAIETAVSLLYEVGAIEGNEELTPLGYHLAGLPVDILIGKMMVYGAIFGCLSPILTISAFLSHKSPFIYPRDENENVERGKLAILAHRVGDVPISPEGGWQSDHLLMMISYEKWEKILSLSGAKAAQKFCTSHFLSSSVMYTIREMRTQFGILLADIGLINIPKAHPEKAGWKNKQKLGNILADVSHSFNQYSKQPAVVKAVIAAGLYPNVAITQASKTGDRPVWFDGKREVHIHPVSVNFAQKAFQYPFLVYLEKVETSKVFLRDTTVISPNSILLFGGSLTVQHQAGLIVVDNWITMQAPAQTAVLFKELRTTLHSILKDLISHPQSSKDSPVNNEVMRSIIQLFLEEDNQPLNK